jgi:hypothetical protein
MELVRAGKNRRKFFQMDPAYSASSSFISSLASSFSSLSSLSFPSSSSPSSLSSSSSSPSSPSQYAYVQRDKDGRALEDGNAHCYHSNAGNEGGAGRRAGDGAGKDWSGGYRFITTEEYMQRTV